MDFSRGAFARGQMRASVAAMRSSTLLLAALFLGEPLTWKTALGGGLVVLGAIVVALK